MFCSFHPLADKTNNNHLPKQFFKDMRKSLYMLTFQNGVWRGEMNMYSYMSGAHGLDKAPFCAHALPRH